MIPHEVPGAQALIKRLCDLQADVAETVFEYGEPLDCFCGSSGFWPLQSPEDFVNTGAAVDFIIDVVRRELDAIRGHRL